MPRQGKTRWRAAYTVPEMEEVHAMPLEIGPVQSTGDGHSFNLADSTGRWITWHIGLRPKRRLRANK